MLVDLEGCPEGASCGDACEDAFLPGELPGAFFGLLLGDVDVVVYEVGGVDAGEVFLRPFADAGDVGAFGGLDAYDLDVGVLLFEVGGDACDGACGAHGAYEVGDLPLGVVPDFGAGAVDVGVGVVGVVELVEDFAFALGLHLEGEFAGVFHALACGAVGEDELGAVDGHGGAPFYREVVGHDEDHVVAADGGYHGEGDAGVAAGGFDEGVAWADVAPGFGLLDHGEGGAVFD